MGVSQTSGVQRLADASPELELILTRASVDAESLTLFSEFEIRCETIRVRMRDATQLATDIYLPPRLPARAVAIRTPYGRATMAAVLLAFACRGYAVISQDCRGTGDSEPDAWDYYVYEPED